MEAIAQVQSLAQRHYLLEALHRMDQSRRMAATAPPTAQSTGHRRRREPGVCDRGLRQCEGKKRGAHTGPNPVDRAKNGCKRHIITDPSGIPLIVQCTPANIRDDIPFLAMLDSTPPVTMRDTGRRRYKPRAVVGDAGYGFEHIILQVVERHVVPILAPRGKRGHPVTHGSGLGRVRYVVERTISWLASFRRITQCYERTGAAWQAFNELACCIICANKLRKFQKAKMVA